MIEIAAQRGDTARANVPIFGFEGHDEYAAASTARSTICELGGQTDGGWMPRNLDRRVEALVPVEHPQLQERLEEVLAINLADDTLTWTLGPDGLWARVDGGGEADTHKRLEEIAAGRVRQPT